MQRRQFLKAALGATLLPFIPIPAPAAPEPLEVLKQEIKKECRNTITTLDGIFKRVYSDSFHRSFEYPASLTRVKI